MTEHHFNRTVCACADCTACCKRQPGPLAPGDFERIVDHLAKAQNVTPEVALEQAKTQFCASPGALVQRVSGQVVRVGTITPQMKKGRCVFLDENDRCSIHAVAPFGCAYFDTHMNRAQAMERSVWLVHQQATTEYQQLRLTLPYARTYKPSAY